MPERIVWTGPKTSGMFVVPEALDRAISAKIDEAVSLHPHLEAEREKLRSDLVAIYNEYGTLDVEICPK